MSIFSFWSGSSSNLLEVTKPQSAINQSMHQDFMSYLCGEGPKVDNTVCVFETVMASLWGMPIIHVSAVVPCQAPHGDTDIPTMQVVDQESAVIDGSHRIGSERDHRNMQKFGDEMDDDYNNILSWISKWVGEAKKEADGKCR